MMSCTDVASNRDRLYTRSHTNSSSISLKRLKKAHGTPHCTPSFLSVRMQCTFCIWGFCLRNVFRHLVFRHQTTWGPGRTIKLGIFSLLTCKLKCQFIAILCFGELVVDPYSYSYVHIFFVISACAPLLDRFRGVHFAYFFF